MMMIEMNNEDQVMVTKYFKFFHQIKVKKKNLILLNVVDKMDFVEYHWFENVLVSYIVVVFVNYLLEFVVVDRLEINDKNHQYLMMID